VEAHLCFPYGVLGECGTGQPPPAFGVGGNLGFATPGGFPKGHIMDSNRNTGKFPLRQWRTALLLGSGVVLVLLVILLGVGVYLDYRSFDRTSGGYDPPYTD
jgi:hypothetical protein